MLGHACDEFVERHLDDQWPLRRKRKPVQLREANLAKAKKFVSAKLVGGPGASHENKKEPQKSKAHARLNKLDPEQGNTKRNAQNKSGKGPNPAR